MIINFLQNFCDHDFQLWDVRSYRLPDGFDFCIEIIMNQFIAHSGNVSPRDMGMLASNEFGYPLDGFADHLNSL